MAVIGDPTVMTWCRACQAAVTVPHSCSGARYVPVSSPPQPSTTYGCICPPGANLDCQSPMCPRRNPFSGTVTYATPSDQGSLK